MEPTTKNPGFLVEGGVCGEKPMRALLLLEITAPVAGGGRWETGLDLDVGTHFKADQLRCVTAALAFGFRGGFPVGACGAGFGGGGCGHDVWCFLSQ